ncbi:AraC family transcriptional regulator [Aliagarivorans marinus]|uniref:AraC family transcriptional regulator n=1 Tax=Aliagarivorans marinus TaxID=561965 RepID=UPI00041D39E9|nr:AraC family transcriptional regulator [Aliagarivorans marinus]
MRAVREDINYINASFNAYLYTCEHFFHPYHFHHEHEIVLIEQGQGRLLVGNEVIDYQANDIFIIGANTPHKFCAAQDDDSIRSVIIQFEPDCFGEMFFELPELKRINKLISQSRYGLKVTGEHHSLSDKIRALIDKQGVYLLIELLGLLAEISEHHQLQLVSGHNGEPLLVKEESKINAAIDWICENYFRDITLEDVADLTNMHKNAFCRSFKAATERTFVQFLTEKRVEHAATQLLQSDKSITQIAFDVGFRNISNFNRSFKKQLKQSPKAYRELTRQLD